MAVDDSMPNMANQQAKPYAASPLLLPALCRLSGQTMGTGLALLGIKTLDRMGTPNELLMECQSKSGTMGDAAWGVVCLGLAGKLHRLYWRLESMASSNRLSLPSLAVSSGLRVFGSSGLRVFGSSGLRVFGSSGLRVFGL